MSQREVWDLQSENAGLRQNLAELKEKLAEVTEWLEIERAYERDMGRYYYLVRTRGTADC